MASGRARGYLHPGRVRRGDIADDGSNFSPAVAQADRSGHHADSPGHADEDPLIDCPAHPNTVSNGDANSHSLRREPDTDREPDANTDDQAVTKSFALGPARNDASWALDYALHSRSVERRWRQHPGSSEAN